MPKVVNFSNSVTIGIHALIVLAREKRPINAIIHTFTYLNCLQTADCRLLAAHFCLQTFFLRTPQLLWRVGGQLPASHNQSQSLPPAEFVKFRPAHKVNDPVRIRLAVIPQNPANRFIDEKFSGSEQGANYPR